MAPRKYAAVTRASAVTPRTRSARSRVTRRPSLGGRRTTARSARWCGRLRGVASNCGRRRIRRSGADEPLSGTGRGSRPPAAPEATEAGRVEQTLAENQHQDSHQHEGTLIARPDVWRLEIAVVVVDRDLD